MKTYRVTFIVDATYTIEVEANNEDEAREVAYSLVESPSICHQCSDVLEVGDCQDIHSVEEVK